jgi:hypothetical protein
MHEVSSLVLVAAVCKQIVKFLSLSIPKCVIKLIPR